MKSTCTIRHVESFLKGGGGKTSNFYFNVILFIYPPKKYGGGVITLTWENLILKICSKRMRLHVATPEDTCILNLNYVKSMLHY